MNTRFSRNLCLAMIVALLLISATPLRAQQIVPAWQCNNYALDPLPPFCLVIPIADGAGHPLPGALVTAQLGNRSIQVRAGQTIAGPAGEAVAALRVEQLGARPGDHIDVRAQAGDLTVRQIIGLRPDRPTRTQLADPIRVVETLGTAPIWGHVYMIDSKIPLSDYKLTLYRDRPDSKPLKQFVPTDSTTFSIDPGPLPSGTPLWLEAVSGDHTAMIMFIWYGNSVELQVVLGWPCARDIPRTDSGTQVPDDDFCVLGQVLLDGVPVAGATVSVELVSDSPSAASTTSSSVLTKPLDPPAELTGPYFAINIKKLLSSKPSQMTRLRFIAEQNNMVGFVESSLYGLGYFERWGTSGVQIALHSQHMGGHGTLGGTPRLVTAIDTGEQQTLYVTARDGLLSWRRASGSDWLSILGNTDTMLGQPEVTALAGRPITVGVDLLIAGFLNGTLARSRDSGRTWEMLPSAGVGVIRGLALSGRQLMILGSTGAGVIDDIADISTSKPTIGTLPALPGQAAALVTDALGQLLAGGSDGLFIFDERAGSWRKLRSEPVSSLAVAGVGPSAHLFVGTAQGLYLTDLSGLTWQALNLNESILSLSMVQGDDRVWAVTPIGLKGGRPLAGSYVWALDTPAEGLVANKSLGTPTVFDITSRADRIFAAATSGVFVSANSGQNWDLLNPTFTHDTRSVAPLVDGTVLALGTDGLFQVGPGIVTQIGGLPATDLNPAVVRASTDGQLLLVGRHGGPGNHLWIRSGQSWSSLPVGAGRGVSDIALPDSPVSGFTALIASESDGLFGWSSGASSLTPFPALLDANGQPLRLGVVLLDQRSGCQIVVGAYNPARIYARPCDITSGWNPPETLTRDGANAASIEALVRAGDRFFAATDRGFFQGQPGGGWQPIFGLPFRPLALVAPQSYYSDRTLIAGGLQSGPVRLFDASPDLALDLSCPSTARGATTFSCTLTLTNTGVLPIAAGTITWTIDPELSPRGSLVSSFPILTSRTGTTLVLTIDVPRDTKPGRTKIRVSSSPVPGDIFTPNNQAEQQIELDYRDAPDPALVIGGQLMSTLTETATLRIEVSNRGTRDMTGTAALHVSISPEVKLGVMSDKGALSNNKVDWTVPALQLQGEQTYTITYSIPITPPLDSPLVVTATLAGGDDREPGNNSDRAELLLPPTEPKVVVLTNWPRLSRRGPVEDARRALATYMRHAGGVEIALDDVPTCEEDKRSLQCAFDASDKATMDLAQASSNPKNSSGDIDAFAQVAVARRNELVAAIKRYVADHLDVAYVKLRYLYIIGDDDVIPYGAKPDALKHGQDVDEEKIYAAALPLKDTLFGIFRANYYPTDRVYDLQINGTRLIASRQPGGPDDIVAALRMYEKVGTLTIDSGIVAGTAPTLTADIQHDVCVDMKLRGLAVSTDCLKVPEHVSEGLNALSTGQTIASYSGHASREVIEKSGVSDLSALNLQTLNLILMLGCHSGLTAGMGNQPTLVTTLAHQGQPSFGYLAYAYAGAKLDSGQEVTAYAEEMQEYLIKRLLVPDTRLADAFQKALADYGPQTTIATKSIWADWHTKTLDTIALFGPPTYQVRVSGATPLPPPPPPVVLPGPGATLSLSFSYTPAPRTDGTVYTVQPSAGEPFTMTDRYLPLQPGVDVTTAAGVGGALIRGGTYTDVVGVDPLIPAIGPIDGPWVYSEPGYQGGSIDRPQSLGRYVDGDGLPHVLIGTGQWLQRDQTERLLQSLSIELLEERAGGSPPQLAGVATSCRLNDRIRVRAPEGTAITRMELVLIEDGRFSVVPMRLVGHVWTATLVAQPWSRYFIQAVGSDGSAVVDTNGGFMYIVPDEHAPCGPPCDINTALSDLETVFLGDDRVRIVNYSLACSYEVGLAAYNWFGPGLDEQQLYDSDKAQLHPEQDVTLRVRLPGGVAQLYAIYGSVLPKDAPPDYGERILASRRVQSGTADLP